MIMGHRVIAMLAPGVAGQQALSGKVSATHSAETFNRLDSIFRAGGHITASTTQKRTDGISVKPDRIDQQLFHA